MAKPILDDEYWTQDFAVTDGDVTRLYAFLQQAEEPQKDMSLLSQVVHHKLEKESLELDARQRQKSEAAAKKLLEDNTVQVYHQTDEYEPGDRLLVAWRVPRPDEWDYGVGEVVEKRESANTILYRWIIRLRFTDGNERSYIAGANLNHPRARELGWKLFDVQIKEEQPIEQAVNDVLRVYGATLVPHLLGQLDEDTRFVRWAQSCWLAELVPELPKDALDRAVVHLWSRGSSATTEALLQALGLPADEPHHWALNLALARDERFENDGSPAVPQWAAPFPDHLLRLTDGTLLDLDTPSDDLWAQHHALFRRPLPDEWTDNPHVLTFGGRWLLEVLLVPLDDDDLTQVRDYLAEQGQAVSDVEILRELFGITPQDGAFDRWRFTLSYRLSQKAEELGVEFVGFDVVIGSDVTWSWALQMAPIEKPERHRRLPGTEGLPTVYITAEQIDAEVTADDEPLDELAEELTEAWNPTRQTWEYVLTYYDWDNGVLPYHRQTREMIPPLSEGQRRAVLHFVAEQVDSEPFEVALCTKANFTWLQGMGLKDLFVGYLIPGARIWVDRTEKPGLFKIRYRPTEPKRRSLLFFEEGRVRPRIREVDIACEVDESMLLTEGRYSDIEALDRLDLVDRRTAPKVLAGVFELIGLKDDIRGVYRAHFDDVFPLLCITKPYSRDYVKQVLYARTRYPWFYRDEEAGETGMFVYDPEKERVVQRTRPRPPRAAEGVWEEVMKLVGYELATLDQQNPFRILEVADTSLQILVGRTGQQRTIRREEIEDAWQHLVSQGELSRSEIHALYSEFNPAYVVAILAALPGVTHKTHPIRLFYQRAKEQRTVAAPEPLAPQPPVTAVYPPVEVPDIGIRHIVYPIPFADTPLSDNIREALRDWVGPIRRGNEITFWDPVTPKSLDDYLMECIADREANRFVTPRQVVDFMVNLAQPKPGERVADICCGTGIFLVKALRFVKEVYGEDTDLELYGADIYDKVMEGTRLSLLANGAQNFTVTQADSLGQQGGLFDQEYDLILGNPPFGGGQMRAFLRRWAELLTNTGRMIVNISEGTLTNSNRISREVRDWLVNNFELESIVSLPRPRDSNLYGAKSNVAFLRGSGADVAHRTMLVLVKTLTELPLVLQTAQRRIPK